MEISYKATKVNYFNEKNEFNFKVKFNIKIDFNSLLSKILEEVFKDKFFTCI
jgi:hypothetical protein